MKISMKLVDQYMAIFFNFPPTSSHLHSLQVENCYNGNSGLKGLIGEQTFANVGCVNPPPPPHPLARLGSQKQKNDHILAKICFRMRRLRPYISKFSPNPWKGYNLSPSIICLWFITIDR